MSHASDDETRLERLEGFFLQLQKRVAAEHGANLAARNALAVMLSGNLEREETALAVACQLEKAYAQCLGASVDDSFLDGFIGYSELIKFGDRKRTD